MAEGTKITQLVAIGSSAGGIEALSIVLATLPTDFGAPVVIGQHLDPTRPSHLGDILARRSHLPVRTVTQSEPLKPGTVYVVPPNRNIQVTDHTISVVETGDQRPRPSVDMLFTSAAEAYGESLIAVILSGTGTDGAAGARMVKRAGGTVVIQDPDTATYPGMPLALAPTTVDIVANAERIGQILVDLLAGAHVPARSEQKQTLQSFLTTVRERYGLDFNTYKSPTIQRRLQRRIVATGTKDLDSYIAYIETHPQEYEQLVNSFLIKVTEFFRDPQLFDYLRSVLVPELIQQARKRGNEIRIWSAGCATGEEAYSLAILLSEALGAALEHFNVRIFATDADAKAITFARRGVYPASSLDHLPPDIIERYFTKQEGSYQVSKRMRALTVFGQHDLGGRAPFPNIDLVLCRNVLIYFTMDLQQRTLRLFAYSLRNGGYLVLGKAETPGQLTEFFAPIEKTLKVYQRIGDRILMPPARNSQIAPAGVRRPSQLPQLPVAPAALGRLPDFQRVRGVNENLVLRLPVGVVVVDRRYDIQTINGAARRYLAIHGTAVGEDLIHIAQVVQQAKLRESIDTALRTSSDVTIEEVLVQQANADEQRYLQITCSPQLADGSQNQVETVMVVVEDITQFVQNRQATERQLAEARAELERVRLATTSDVATRDQTIARLAETNRQLIEANQELTTTNEELRSANEEYLLNTEEAQAAIEEVETLNEELQATNEELETLNEELQSTIEELNTTNEDLNARSSELQEMAGTSERERARLTGILSAIGDAVLVVDERGSTLLTNTAYDHLFNVGGSPVPLGDAEGKPLPSGMTPPERAAHGETFAMEFTVDTQTGERHWYEAVGSPVLDANGKAIYGVVVIRDITERSLRRLQDEFVALASHELRTPLTPIQSYLQMLQRRYEDESADPQARHYVEAALSQVRRLSRLVNDLLDIRRLQSGTFTITPVPVRLDEVMAQTVELARTLATGQEIALHTNDGPLMVNGDEQRLQQVVLNLLTNAITYAPGTNQIDARLSRDGDEAVIQVQDFGPGIPPDKLPLIFARFYQAEPRQPGPRPSKGLGIGLFIAHEIVGAHGGTISVESTVGGGTTFTVRLPLLQD